MKMIAALTACLAALPAAARETGAHLPPEVPARVVSVHDGDTFRASALVWPDVTVSVSVRVKGIDTPELRGKCESERKAALAARAAARGLLAQRDVVLRKISSDKYRGRVAAQVILPDGRDLAAVLLAAGHGRAYDGGTRRGWCN